MPRGDRTGPAGMGPMTGRGAGYCAGYATPGFANPGFRRGMGMAWGRGGGYGMGMARGRGGFGFMAMPYAPAAPYYAAPSPQDELEMLRTQADWLKSQMDSINRRISELEQNKG